MNSLWRFAIHAFGACLVLPSCLVLPFFLALPCGASVNELNFLFALQDSTNNNFLFSFQNPEKLLGLQAKPQIGYEYNDGIYDAQLNVKSCFERYNRHEFNGNFPSVDIGLKKLTETGEWDLGFAGSQQSTNATEFNDSGVLEAKATRRDESTLTFSWVHALSEQNSVRVSSDASVVNYQSDAYADLKNVDMTFVDQWQWSPTLSVYGGPSFSQYESQYLSYFPVQPIEVQGILLCPPESYLVSTSACYLFKSQLGEAKNITRSTGLRLGAQYFWSEQWSLHLDVGRTNSRTLQQITQAVLPVYFGSPIDQELKFGGLNENRSQSEIAVANSEISYQTEKSHWKLGVSQQLLPSSLGTLRKSIGINLDVFYQISPTKSCNLNIDAQNFSELDSNIVSSVNVNRKILSAQLGFNQNWTQDLVVRFALNYQQQKLKLKSELDADAWSSQLSLTYRPRSWSW